MLTNCFNSKAANIVDETYEYILTVVKAGMTEKN